MNLNVKVCGLTAIAVLIAGVIVSQFLSRGDSRELSGKNLDSVNEEKPELRLTALLAQMGADVPAEIQNEVLELSKPDSRFLDRVDRVKDVSGVKMGRLPNEELLDAFQLEGSRRKSAMDAIGRFLDAMMALESDGMRPHVTPDAEDGYLLVPARPREQAELKQAHAAKLAAKLDDAEKALLLLQVVSRDYNSHGNLGIIYRVFETDTPDGPLYEVEQVELSRASKTPMTKKSIGSARSLSELPPPFADYFSKGD